MNIPQMEVSAAQQQTVEVTFDGNGGTAASIQNNDSPHYGGFMIGNSNTNSQLGGGICATESILTLSGNLQIKNNSAQSCGGAIFISGGELNIKDTVEISGNKAVASEAVENISASYASAIYACNADVFIADQVEITENEVVNNETAAWNRVVGAVYIQEGHLTIEGNVKVNNNISAGIGNPGGGAITVYHGAHLTINGDSDGDGVEICDNTGPSGGGIYLNTGQSLFVWDLNGTYEAGTFEALLQEWHTTHIFNSDSFSSGMNNAYSNHDMSTEGPRASIRIYYVDEEGELIAETRFFSLVYEEDYKALAPPVTGYVPIGYQILDGPLAEGSAPVITAGTEVEFDSVDSNLYLCFVYRDVDPSLDVSIPVKLLWAAFEDTGGAVESPKYKVINYSEVPVKVDIVLKSIDISEDIELAASGVPGQNQLRFDLAGGDAGLMVDNPFPATIATGMQVNQSYTLGTLEGTVLDLYSDAEGKAGMFEIKGAFGEPRPVNLLLLKYTVEFCVSTQ